MVLLGLVLIETGVFSCLGTGASKVCLLQTVEVLSVNLIINKYFNNNSPKGPFQCHVYTVTELTVDRPTRLKYALSVRWRDLTRRLRFTKPSCAICFRCNFANVVVHFRSPEIWTPRYFALFTSFMTLPCRVYCCSITVLFLVILRSSHLSGLKFMDNWHQGHVGLGSTN